MSSIVKLILSDLHLADGHPLMEGFGKRQQTAFEGLLHSACNGELADPSDEVELIINGDCFDFLAVPPYNTHGLSDPTTASTKLEKIVAVHQPFFTALRRFVELPGRRVTFLTGNHDVELCFAEVRARLYDAFTLEPENSRIVFHPELFYRPLPDVYIEHGNQYDFWNRFMPGLWDETGQSLTRTPATLMLPNGSLYVQEVTHMLNMKYPYFDHFEPSMNTIRQIGLLSLLNPDFLQKLVARTHSFLSRLEADFTPDQQPNPPDVHSLSPVELFNQTILDFARLQLALSRRNSGVNDPQMPESHSEDLQEFAHMQEALALPTDRAIATVCIPAVYQMEKSVAQGLEEVLNNDSTLRYAIAGHTHMLRFTPIEKTGQAYINTGTWTSRFAQPTPDEVTPEMVAWLREPDWQQIPLREMTQLSFILVKGIQGQPSNAQLCSWESGTGTQGRYRILTVEEGNKFS